jgi:xylose isomerase
MDAFAHGLKIAAQIRKDGVLKQMVDQRYSSWESGVGVQISEGSATFETLEKYMLEKGEITPNVSGRQELFEMVLNRYIK